MNLRRLIDLPKLLLLFREPGNGRKNQWCCVGRSGRAEVEHVVEGTGDGVGRSPTDEAQIPVLLDEEKNGTLVGHRVIHEVLFGPR